MRRASLLTSAGKMAKSRAEVQKAYRKRKGDELRSKEKERLRRIREVQKKDPVKMAKIRKQKALVMKRLRMKEKARKLITPPTDKCAYKSYSSERRATIRALGLLPNSSTKKQVVVRNLNSLIFTSSTPPTPRERLSKDTIEKITDFYQRDSISRWCAGRKEFVKVGREKTQKRFLLYSLKECYAMFVEEFGELVKMSKFASLRPRHVFSYGSTPVESCCCLTHQNFMHVCDALALHLEGVRKYDSLWVEDYLMCSPPTEHCRRLSCSTCSHGQLFDIKVLKEDSDQNDVCITYKWWVSEGKRVEQVIKTESLQDCIEKFRTQCSSFLVHHATQKQQSLSFSRQKLSEADEKQKIFHFDFSENFSCFYQDAAQSTYWAQHQITLFTVALYRPGESPQMLCFVTDLNDHTKTSVSYVLNRLMMEFCEAGDNVIFWSDGPSSQFKNRFMLEYMKILTNKFDLWSLRWNFFATSHGKGAIDGVGGSLKRTVHTCVKARQAVVQNAMDFVNTIKSHESAVIVHHVPSTAIDDFYQSSISATLESAPKKPGIKSSHYWECLSTDLDIKMERLTPVLSESETWEIPPIHLPASETAGPSRSTGSLVMGDYVVVKFQGCDYVGRVTRVYSTVDFDGTFMRKKRENIFSFPMNPDNSAFGLEDVVAQLNRPSKLRRGDAYDFTSSQYDFSTVR